MPPQTQGTTSVQVALRIRPTTAHDQASIPQRFQREIIHATGSTAVAVDPSTGPGTGTGPSVAATAPSKKQTFAFDQVHGPPTTQHAMFTSTAQPLIARFLEGFNCTILAYGQTSSGKTFTMTGVDLDANPADPNNNMGIIPRAVSTIFKQANALKQERAGAWNYSIKGSFIEIYNEDLLDLLDDSSVKREVQIREDKAGHIIWDGLKEIGVKSAGEVMTLIRRGTSIRRTNETDMNAQSSRSHAIFSLTLTQKKYTGGGNPTPQPATAGRSPSRLARPGSVYSGANSEKSSRVGSPTFGRPATPSFAAAMNRGGLRPSSALGHAGDKSFHGGHDDEPGEWVTVVSKFHFVDLAGSERLKRTAAAGERIKEGISINSGLLALGNVISALGDPSRAKSHTASHIPYRDSKLTRLLQDSLGGNAHTLMIACVSPAEYNVGETVNTLKYANRARNIKNRAVINEKEDGWDDIEWLQGTVSRLRKEVKSLKDGGAIPSTSSDNVEGAGKKVLAQMTELQNNYEDLREKFVDRTEELTRLRRELGEKTRNSTGGALGGTGKYEEIVGPVIEEYEKTISAMEAELSLNRAALRHTNEMVEEKEEELAAVTERHAATELYVEELRGRAAKLQEREASTEAYIRDLEEKVKAYDETTTTSSESMGDLKREISRFRDTESNSSKYIVDLEARLARSDESVISLQQAVEKLEAECDRRRSEAETLKVKLETLQSDGEGWRTDLEERERKLRDLEERMEDWERKKAEAGEERNRLGGVEREVASARRSLQVDLTTGQSVGSTPTGEETAEKPAEGSVEAQLHELRQTHTATLADLSSVTSKYRDALREISDLAGQIQEAKLGGSSTATDSSSTGDKPVELSATSRRRKTSNRVPVRGDSINGDQLNSSGRRLFFRQAASTESLHSRSLSQSLSLSQELSSVHSRKTSFSSHGSASISSSHSPSNSGGAGTTSYFGNGGGSRPNLSISLPPHSAPPNGYEHQRQRTVQSLEKEIMRLQEVLKEREKEISLLEGREVDEVGGTAKPTVNGVKEHPTDFLSPKTIGQFDTIKKGLSNGNAVNGDGDNESEKQESVLSETDENLERLNELMLSMAQKETKHRETVDDLTSQLTTVRKQHEELTTLSRDQASNMSLELEALQTKHDQNLSVLEKVQQHEDELTELLEKEKAAHAATEEALSKVRSGHEAALAKLSEEHEETLKQQAADSSATQHRIEEEYYNALTKIRGDHASALETHSSESAAALERLKEEHASALRQAELAREGMISESQSSSANAIKELQDEHAAALSKKDSSLQQELDALKTDHQRALTTKDDDARIATEKAHAEYESALESLKSEHVAALAAAVKTATEEALANADSERSSLARQHTEYVTQLKSQHQQSIAEVNSTVVALQDEHRNALESLRAHQEETLVDERGKIQKTLEDLRSQHADERATMLKDHDLLVEELETYKAAAEEYTASRDVTLMNHEKILSEKTELVSDLQRQLSIANGEKDDVDSRLALVQAELDKTRSEQSKLIQESSKRESLVMELERHRSVLAELQENLQKVKDEKDTLQTEKMRAEGQLKELQAQVASRAPSSPPTSSRTMSGSRVNAPSKLPPPTPPPSVPPPPAPKTPGHVNGDSAPSSSSQATSSVLTTSSSRDSQPESPSTSVAGSSLGHGTAVDTKLNAKIEQQAKHIDEQDAMIKTLNKQLTHCETDLQTHMDLVGTLETSLGDSEKNLRKARMHATELARERDTLSGRITSLQTELDNSRKEVANVRRSVVEEKQSLEQRLDEERKLKERARQQLDSRMDEVQKRKSKFACL